MNIAIYSGSFNPIHTGHAMLASWCCQFCPDIDEVWLMVSPQNPLKRDKTSAPQEQRLEMVRIVAEGCTGVRASDFEFSLPLPSYTYRTLRALHERYPEHTFRLLTGADNWLLFDRWRDSQKIIDEFGLLIYPRPGYPVDTAVLPEGVRYLANAPQIEISSSFIRESIAASLNMNYFLPSSVYRYIIENKIYSDGKS